MRWKPADVHFQLKRVQYIDFHQQEFRAALERLSAELKRQGINVGGSDGEMHEIQADDVVSPPPEKTRAVIKPGEKVNISSTAVLVTTQNQGGEITLLRVEDILPPPFDWCEIPAGKVTLEAGGYLEKATTFDVPVFWMAKYPVTNGQFQVFVDDREGYSNAAWWDYSEHAMDWRLEHARPEDAGVCR